MSVLIRIYPLVLYLSVIAVTGLFYTTACNENTAGPEKEIVLPDSNLNYIEHIQPLLITNCANKNGCHGSFEPARGLDLTDYQVIRTHLATGSEQLIIIYDSEASFLYNILKGPVRYVPRMPLYEPMLKLKYINGIKQWIDEGANEFP